MPTSSCASGEFLGNIEELTLANTWFRDVLHTTPQMQLVVMSVAPGGDVPMERHPHTTQLIRVEGHGGGNGLAIVGGTMGSDGMVRGATIHRLGPDSLLIVPPNTWHTVINSGGGSSALTPLQIYTVYSPPEHEPGTRHRRRSDDPEIGQGPPIRRHAPPYFHNSDGATA